MDRIVIVGNAPPAAGAGEAIDAADVVVRIKRVNFFGTGGAGWRTDVLAVRPARRYTRSHAIFSRGAYPAREIWFLRPPRARIVGLELLGRPQRIVPGELVDDLADQLHRLGGRRNPIPSAGLVTVAHAMRVWPDAKVELACFTWQGIEMHDWPQERRLCESWAEEGRLSIASAARCGHRGAEVGACRTSHK